MVRDLSPGRGAIFCTGPDRPWVQTILLYNVYRMICGGSAAGAWRYPPRFSGEVKARVELYISFPSVPSRQVIGRSLIYYQCSSTGFIVFVYNLFLPYVGALSMLL